MKKITCLLTLLALPLGAMAYGEVGQWSSGWGQGTSEYNVTDAAGNSLYIACSEDRPVSMTLTVKGAEYGTYSDKGFDLLVDGEEVQTPYETASRVGANNFIFVWDALRKAKTLQAKTSDGQVVTLPTKGSAKELPASGTQGFACTTEF
ncbi:hypothetical protein CCOS865_02265 [Pseudomonas reidholzensis]|uniref:Uncharacterized protein n=1 Tax=Pseudomonas reidholzensis TaxID=1785162 RepID=A0A383RSF0_9PSED|nr:hypothetical protein [Pseudomonas reidholzensis]SYX89999.1 hypothetical protein CCOS865_02265 [Pseudomonas reidholzensis]